MTGQETAGTNQNASQSLNLEFARIISPAHWRRGPIGNMCLSYTEGRPFTDVTMVTFSSIIALFLA